MTREQRRLLDSLWSALREHRQRHGCAEVEVADPAADALYRFMGPSCADAADLRGFICDFERKRRLASRVLLDGIES